MRFSELWEYLLQSAAQNIILVRVTTVHIVLLPQWKEHIVLLPQCKLLENLLNNKTRVTATGRKMTIADLGDRETHGNQICQPVKRILVELLYYANTLCIGGKKVQLLSWRAHLVVQLKGFPLSVWESLRWILISNFCILPQAALLHIVLP